MFGRVSRRSTGLVFWAVAGRAICLGALPAASPARANEKLTYLFPAPPLLPAFGPIQLAKGKGYFSQAGLDVNYAVGRGGVDVAKEVGAGNAPLGGIVADGPIIVRQNGVPIKVVAVFGGKGFMQLVVREDSNIEKPADLKGKTITVMSYQDTTFYALLGLLASAGLTQDDVNIQAAGPVGVWQMVATGKSAGMAGVPDWIAPLQATGVAVKIAADRRIFSAYGAGYRRVRSDHQGQAGYGPRFRQGGAAWHEGHHGRSRRSGRRFRQVRAGMDGQDRSDQGRIHVLRQACLSGAKLNSARSIPSGSPSCRIFIWRRASSRGRPRSTSFTPISSSSSGVTPAS